jgi:hypothetical protein
LRPARSSPGAEEIDESRDRACQEFGVWFDNPGFHSGRYAEQEVARGKSEDEYDKKT